MNKTNFMILLTLSAIWGSSFLFMRMAAPVLGPVVLIAFRVGLAALFLLLIALMLKKELVFFANWRHFLTLGTLNAGAPFLCLAYGAQTLSASLLSIINATAPIWGAIIGAILHRSKVDVTTAIGLALGVTGVSVLVGNDKLIEQDGALLAIFVALGAPFFYGIASHYAKSAKKLDSFANANGSMWGAFLPILPAVYFFPASTTQVSTSVILAVLLIGVVCSGIAYLLFFRLISEVGPTSALTVTFLVPVFGIFWGWFLLEEEVGIHTFIGSFIVIFGTALVTGFNPFKKAAKAISS
ncbi:DMT family transporter [Marinomonas dokdonensis]|uniref:DMT family transporter n=1 Tax=Marinomonas dokdonensis TaxID=328224 RepID=UPI0040553D2D